MTDGGRGQDEVVALEHSAIRMRRVGFFLSLLAMVTCVVVAILAHMSSRKVLLDEVFRTNLSVARTFAEFYEAGSSADIEALWKKLSADDDSYLCVVKSDGRLLVNTAWPAGVGKNVGQAQVALDDEGRLQPLQTVLDKHRDWVGDYRSIEGQQQVTAFAYAPGLDGYVAIHLPRSTIDAAISKAELPWALGLGIIAFVLIPLALFFQGRAYLAQHIQAVTLTETRSRLRAAVDQTDESILITDVEGKIIFANPAFCRTSGYALEELLGVTPKIIKSGLHPPEFYTALWETLARGEIWSGEFVNRRKDGSLLSEKCTISPIFSADGVLSSYVQVKHDVTREQVLEIQLRHSQKMEAVGRLAAGVAHDFNNLLTVITLHTHLLKDGLGAESAQSVDRIETASEAAAGLIDQLLTFSRQRPFEPERVDVNTVVTDTMALMKITLGKAIDVTVNLDETPLPVWIDPALLQQVLMNLVGNAKDAMPEGGTLTVGTEVLMGPCDHHGTPVSLAGPLVALCVADTGVGIDKALLDRVFEPFFTTKEVGKGTGLGLSTAFGVVEQAGGHIAVDSELGEGTRFTMYFPRATDA